ncbi:MAG: hypothetical protein NC114_06350 [Ruminococcus flavefaciens]|nr:hypothetical protein [Ruminococcus flavefaciens]
MSKDKSKKKDKGYAKIGGSQTATGSVLKTLPIPEETQDSDGFAKLSPTAKGDTAFTEFMQRRSKKSPLITKPEPPVAYSDYDPSKAANQITKSMEFIGKNKFGKAYDILDKTVITDLLDAFQNMDQTLSNAPLVNKTVTKLLQVCKSFYEYDGKQREVIPNNIYDGVLAKYTGLGLVEPTGIVPKTDKKTGIKYPELHNNMDKAYILKEGELVPEGVKETDSVEDFLRRAYFLAGLTTNEEITIELSPKIDGVSVNGTMKRGCLVDPQTRGDQDASMAIKWLSGIELGDSKNDDEFGIQYECFVTDEDRIKAGEYLKLARPYVSNRHAAAGIINRLCTNEDDKLLEFLSFFPIEATDLDEEMSYENRMKFLKGFACVPDDMIKRTMVTGNLETLLKEIKKKFRDLYAQREELSYAIDGLVITVASDKLQTMIGRNGRTNKYQIAYKFDPANAEAIVKGIYLDSGRKGYRTIQVELEHPVFLDGVRYDHVPVLSADLYDKLDLRVGSTVNVHRVGDVIPSISLIKEGSGKKLKLPKSCPDCNGPLEIKNKKLICQNGNCKGNVVGKYLAFLDAIGVDGYAEAFVSELVTHLNRLYLGHLYSICSLTEDDMRKFGMTDKLSLEFPDKVANGLATAPDYVILGAMGWSDIGPARAKELLRGYGGLKKFVDKFGDTTMPCDWKRYIGEIGAKSANQIMRDPGLRDDLHNDLIAVSRMIKNITRDFSEKIKVGHTGGDLSDKAIEVCRAHNMEVVDGSSFDILITSNMNSTSGKMEKARKRNLPIYLEDEFIKEYDR